MDSQPSTTFKDLRQAPTRPTEQKNTIESDGAQGNALINDLKEPTNGVARSHQKLTKRERHQRERDVSSWIEKLDTNSVPGPELRLKDRVVAQAIRPAIKPEKKEPLGDMDVGVSVEILLFKEMGTSATLLGDTHESYGGYESKLKAKCELCGEIGHDAASCLL